MLLQNRGMEVNMDNDVALDRSREAQPLYIQIKNIVKFITKEIIKDKELFYMDFI